MKIRLFFYKHRFICLIILIVALFLFIVCGNKQPSKSIKSNLHYNGYFPHDIDWNLDKTPSRAIVLRPEIADTLIKLGAGKSVIAAYISPERERDIDYFLENMPNAEILTTDLSKEEAILMNPDIIIGWNGSFSGKTLGDTAYWNKRKVKTYIEENSGALPDPYPPFKHSGYPPFSVANEIQFIKNMGTIFSREDNAKAEIDKINNTLEEVQKLAKEKGPRTVLTMQFRRGKVEVLGENSLSGDIIRQIGCTNISYLGLLMPIENLLVLNPDSLIVIYDYVGGDASLENQMLLLKSYPYNQIPVVNSNHIGALQYFNDLIATNVHTSDSIWKIYKAIYEPSI